MSRPASIRWFRAGLGTLFAGAAMLAGAIATGSTHGPMALTVVFGVLAVLCALAGFILSRIGAKRARAENQRLVAQARARAERESKRD